MRINLQISMINVVTGYRLEKQKQKAGGGARRCDDFSPAKNQLAACVSFQCSCNGVDICCLSAQAIVLHECVRSHVWMIYTFVISSCLQLSK